MFINSNTKVMGLIGHPVKHSFSPIMQNYLLDKYEINKVYMCFDVECEKLGESIDGIKALGISYLNVTIPHKVDIIKYLDDIDKNAKLIGAVNTIKNEDGKLKGYNTDGVGFVKSVTDKSRKIKDKKVLILGAGGACRSIAVELASNGAESIEIRNRSIDKAKEIAQVIDGNFHTKVIYGCSEVKSEDLENIDILINTTPIGMESNECPLDKNIKTHKNLLVCDIVYKPHNTELLKWANSNGLEVIYGIEMLINQGMEAFDIWTGIKPTSEDIKNIRKLYERGI